MLTVTLFLAACVTVTHARPFNITYLYIPNIVLPGQQDVDIECRYDANFTLLSWFKGHYEFFRYRPGEAPTTRSFPILGVGTVEMLACGPTACRLRLGALTEEASGEYRCDIERDVPPYKFDTRTSRMEVHGHEYRRPLLEGLGEEYGEGDMMQAYCRGAPDSELHWYINGKEIEDMRGSVTLKKKITRFLFVGLPPTVTVQCAEFRYGKIYGSKEAKARWNEVGHIRKDDKKVPSNKSELHLASIPLVSIILYLVNL